MITKEQQNFINFLVPLAQKSHKDYGVFASVTIAQACYESTWGTSYLANHDNALFGIKTPGNHNPNLTITQGSWATDDGGYYCHYLSREDSVDDHGYFLRNNSRYPDHGVFTATTPQQQLKAIMDAGYAGTEYYEAACQIIESNNLIQYDTGTYTGGDSANSQSDALSIQATNYQIIKDSEKYGDVLFGRRYRITVSDEGGTAIDVSQLRCTFNIIKTIQMEPNLAEISIYNLNANTENSITINGKRITVEAGYEGSQFGLIFDGDILQTIRERENGTTFKLTIIALDSDRAINFNIANYSIVRGQTARSIVDYVANKAQYPINLGSISEKLEGQKLTRGKVMFGKASDYIRQIAKTYDLQHFTDDGTLNLISLEELPEGEIFELSPKSGLIGTPEQTDYGISGKCLLNPQIKLNSLIHIDNSLVRAKKISINGSNVAPNGGVAVENSNNLSNARNAIIAEAKRLCDDPNIRYSQELRGQTVNGLTYYDCSAFTEHCYKVAGLYINPTSQLQWAQVKAKGMTIVDISAALPGDIVFWFDGNGECYHVAIYGGNNDIYAARSSDKSDDEQVSYGAIYGNYKIGRPDCLISADGGEFPSANSNTNSTNSASDTSQTLFRSLDKDGIYRVIKITYTGDTRGQDWYLNFETIDQLGGAIAAVSS